MAIQPRDAVAAIERAPALPPGVEERFAGYGVMGVPFSRGHYLGLRRFPASSLGPAYTTVWWRDPLERWVFFSNVSPTLSCARFFGSALTRAERVPDIELRWSGSRSLQVTIPGHLDWQMELGSTPATRLMSALGRAAPRWLWRSPAALGATGPLAGLFLDAGTLRLQGDAPNGQRFQATARQAWVVTSSQATIDGQDAGTPAPLARQARMGDLWLPQRGLFFVGEAFFEPSPPPATGPRLRASGP